MSSIVYYCLSGLLIVGVLIGIAMMSKVKTAYSGNFLSAICMAVAIVLTLVYFNILNNVLIWCVLVVSLILSVIWSKKIKMIEMPQVVALFNGFGGGASALVGIILLLNGNETTTFSLVTAGLAIAVGMVTLTGSLVAAGKLTKILSQRPVILPYHQAWTTLLLITSIAAVVIAAIPSIPVALPVIAGIVLPALFGIVFAIRVGGADMPITISLLNSLSGVAGSIAGMSIGDPLLTAVGGIVGASGLLLTQVMCKAMNRHLSDILLGKTSAAASSAGSINAEVEVEVEVEVENEDENVPQISPAEALHNAKSVIIVPGYGMALAQAQAQVKELYDQLESMGKDVRFAIHPVAGRMPGHMNVLLCEVFVPYDKLYEMDAINDDFADCDVSIIVGANDVVNPAARFAEGTPIYGMPVLDVDHSKHVIICNYDLKPGYAGVDNPLYSKKHGVSMLLGDAKDSVQGLLDQLKELHIS